jgi:uncharacterized protein (TIRG00374 family)
MSEAASRERAAEAARTPAPSRSAWLERHGAKLAISIVLGAGIAWLVARGGLPLVPPASAFAHLRPWTVPAYVLSLACVHWFRAARWRFLLRPLGEVPLRGVISVSWVSFAIILLSPLRSGELARPLLVSRRGSVRVWEAAGTVAAERVIDGLIVSLLLFVPLTLTPKLSPLPEHVGDLHVSLAAVPRAAYGVLAVFFAAFAAMGIFYWRRAWARRVTRAVVGVVSPRLADKLAGVVERVADGLRFLPSARLLTPFFLETLAYWLVNVLGLWLIAWGSGLDAMRFSHACVVMGLIGIGILVPSGPGYFGAFQLSAFMALAMYFPEPTLRGPAACFVFLLYVCQVGFHLVAALAAFAFDPALRLAPPPLEPQLSSPDLAARGS